MSRPFFSVIVPTRNRSVYLRSAIQTVLCQSFDDFELIISDNSDDDKTYNVVKSFTDKRIKYYRTDKVLLMADNFEFALTKAVGEYVTYFGDDDGLLPWSLKDAHELIQKEDADAVSSRLLLYNWNDLQYHANQIEIYSNLTEIHYCDKNIITEVLYGESTFQDLPMIYYSFISRELIEKAKSYLGRLFIAAAPDIISGLIFGYLANKYIIINKPLFIGGSSGQSTGVNTVHNIKNGQIEDFKKLLKGSEFEREKELIDILPHIQFLLLYYFFKCQKALYSRFELVEYDSEKVAENFVESFRAFNIEHWYYAINTMGLFLDDGELNMLIQKKFETKTPNIREVYGIGVEICINKDRSVFDGKRLDIHNTYDLALFMDKLIGTVKIFPREL